MLRAVGFTVVLVGLASATVGQEGVAPSLALPHDAVVFDEPSVLAERLGALQEGQEVRFLASAEEDWWKVRSDGVEGFVLVLLEDFEPEVRSALKSLVAEAKRNAAEKIRAEKRTVVDALSDGSFNLRAEAIRDSFLEFVPTEGRRGMPRTQKLASGTECRIQGAATSPFGLGGRYWIATVDGQRGFVAFDGSLILHLEGQPLSESAKDFAYRYLAVRDGESIREGRALLVHSVVPDWPNSAGGVDVLMPVENLHDARTIKYLTVELTPFNAVGDPVVDRVSGESTVKVRATGPIDPGAFRLLGWEDAWHNETIVCVEVKEIAAEYIDGSEDSPTLEDTLSPHFENDCSYVPN